MLIALLVCTPCSFVAPYRSDLPLFVYTKVQVCHHLGCSYSLSIHCKNGIVIYDIVCCSGCR